MKVYEEGTDRRAELNLFTEGSIDSLDEYGEYVDPSDGALCCFVPVEKGAKIRIGGKFNGTTMTLHYDVLIDGICRKSNAYLKKTVAASKAKRLDFNKFLFRTKDGILDTDIMATHLSDEIVIEEDAPSNLGTIEMRVCVLRRFGDQHPLRDVPVYYEVYDEGHNTDSKAGYSNIPPDFSMTLEKNCTLLDSPSAKRFQKKVDAVRPGTAPWAIFRFHYRSEEAIKDSGLQISYAHDWAKSEYTHNKLNIESVPHLKIGTKPGDEADDDADSTRPSSPTSSILPETPIAIPYPGVDQKNKKMPRELPTDSPTTPPQAISKQSSPKEISPDTTIDLERVERQFIKGPAALTSSGPNTMASQNSPARGKGKAKKLIPFEDDTDDETEVEDEDNEKVNNEGNNTELAKSKGEGDVANNEEAGKTSARNVEKATAEDKTATASQAVINEQVRIFKSADGKAAPSVAPKRIAEVTPADTPTPKRAKEDSKSLFVSPDSTASSPSLSYSLGAGFSSMTQNLAASRQRIVAAKAKRAELANKQRQVDESLAPYLKQMQEEIDNLSKLADEEENDIAESEEQLRVSMELLEKYQNGGK